MLEKCTSVKNWKAETKECFASKNGSNDSLIIELLADNELIFSVLAWL